MLRSNGVTRERATAAIGVCLFACVAGASSVTSCGTESTRGGEPTPSDVAAEDAPTDDATDTDIADSSQEPDVTLPRDVQWDGPIEPQPADVGPIPVVACGMDPDSSIACPLPPSRCVDTRWLETYVSGSCDAGTCSYWRVFHDCKLEGGSFCLMDRCQFAVGK
jgi:hypothetical protein